MAQQGGTKGEIILKRKQDVFDAPDFDPIKLINNLYPDELSLTDLDRFIGLLRKQVRVLQGNGPAPTLYARSQHTLCRSPLDVASCITVHYSNSCPCTIPQCTEAMSCVPSTALYACTCVCVCVCV